MNHFCFERTGLEGICLITPKIFSDDRGCFMEIYQKSVFSENGITREFVQENYSKSAIGTIRGIGFQKNHTQGKLVRVISGGIYDVAVDVRPKSPTFGKYFGTILSSKNNKMLWIPEGFAHGFLAIEDSSEIVYKCTNYYDPESEGGILWNDPRLAIDWPQIDCDFIINKRDKSYLAFDMQDFSWANDYL